MSYSINFYFHFPEYVFLLLHFLPPHFKSVSYNQHLLVLFCFVLIESAFMKGSTPLADPFCWAEGICFMHWDLEDLESSRSDLTPYHLWENHLTSLNPSILICKIGIKPSTKFLVVLKWDNIQEIPLETKWYYTTVNCYCPCRFTSLSESLARYLIFWG